MRLLICAGGTGGGVYPALTVLQELNKEHELHLGNSMHSPEIKQEKDAVLWVGGEGGMEAELVSREGIPFKSIPAAGVHGVGIRTLPGNLIKLSKGYMAARKMLLDFKPRVLFFTGGYVAIPVGLAARMFAGIKPSPQILVFIPDIEPGQAIKTLTYLADHIVVTTEETRRYLPARKPVTCTGYPVREGLKRWERRQALEYFDLQDDISILLVFGGSSGARSINQAILASLPDLLREIQVLHVSGHRDWSEIQQRSKSLSPELSGRYRAFPYLHDEMGAAMTAADLVLSRAGAAALGEYPQFGLPAILVPYPYAWRYQHTNAQYLVSRGGAILLEDAELNNQLSTSVLGLINDRERLELMSKAMKSAARPNAAIEIAAIIKELAATTERPRT